MNKELFLSAKLENVSRVYSGKRNCCRCGCKGDYVATSFSHSRTFSDVNDILVERRLRRAQKLVANGANVDYWEAGVDVETGNDRTLTFYFEDLERLPTSFLVVN